MDFTYRWLVAVVLIVAAVGKLADLPAFVVALRRLRVVSSFRLAVPVSITIPVIEVLLGVMLMADVFARQAALSAAALFAVFTVVLTTRLVRGDVEMGCGCFGSGGRLSWLHIARNVGLVLVATAVCIPGVLVGVCGLGLLGGAVIPKAVSGFRLLHRT
jgi:uncharacterized membrane protein YphA (DoxX/SURF4 family)